MWARAAEKKRAAFGGHESNGRLAARPRIRESCRWAGWMDARKIEAGCARDPEGSARHGRNQSSQTSSPDSSKENRKCRINRPFLHPKADRQCAASFCVSGEDRGGTAIRDVPSNSPVPHDPRCWRRSIAPARLTTSVKERKEESQEGSANGRRRVDILFSQHSPNQKIYFNLNCRPKRAQRASSAVVVAQCIESNWA